LPGATANKIEDWSLLGTRKTGSSARYPTRFWLDGYAIPFSH
jgi:hypothetical protein